MKKTKNIPRIYLLSRRCGFAFAQSIQIMGITEENRRPLAGVNSNMKSSRLSVVSGKTALIERNRLQSIFTKGYLYFTNTRFRHTKL